MADSKQMPIWKISQMVCIFVFLAASVASAQASVNVPQDESDPSTAEPPAALEQAYQSAQMTLRQSMIAFISHGVTFDQVDAWFLQNISSFRLEMRRAQRLSAYGEFQPMTYVSEVAIPDDATSGMEDFLVANGNLFNGLAQIHNQLAQANGESITIESGTALNETSDELFAQQHGAELQAQQARAASLAEFSAHQPFPPMDPLIVPVDASPQMRAFLVARDQLQREEAAVHNQYCAGDVGRLDAAVEQWEQQNAGKIQLVNQLARALAASTQN